MLSASAGAAHLAIRDAALPAGTMIVTVERHGALIFADGDTILEPGDRVSALARPEEVGHLREQVEGGEDPRSGG